MDKKIEFFMIALALVLSATACTQEPKHVVPPGVLKNIRYLSDAEMKDIEGRLSKHPTKQYAYRVVRLQSQNAKSRTLTETNKSDLRGLILMRDTKRFTPLGGRFYDDGTFRPECLAHIVEYRRPLFRAVKRVV